MIRETLRDDSATRIVDTEKYILMTEWYGAGTRECELTESISVSRFPAVFERRIGSLFIHHGSQSANFSTKLQSS